MSVKWQDMRMPSQVTEATMLVHRSTLDYASARATALPARPAVARPRSPLRVAFSLALPTVAAAIALWVHLTLPNQQNPAPTHHYPAVLKALLGASPLLALLYLMWPAARRWARDIAPIVGAGILVTSAWDLITLKFALLPLPFFPGPNAVLVAMADDWRRLVECTYRSLILLVSGYSAGGIMG